MVIHVLYVCKIQCFFFFYLIIFISDSIAVIILYSVYYLACKQNEDKKISVSNVCAIYICIHLYLNIELDLCLYQYALQED